METNFWIQASYPRTTGKRNPEDSTLGEALEVVFPMWAEAIILVWNGVFVPVGYKYDFSFLIDDVLLMCQQLLVEQSGEFYVYWPSNTFASQWMLRWSDDIVNIDTKWHDVVGGTEALLNARPSISISKHDFIAEWRKPLEIVLVALTEAGYVPSQIPEILKIQQVIERIPRSGVLYSESAIPTDLSGGSQP